MPKLVIQVEILVRDQVLFYLVDCPTMSEAVRLQWIYQIMSQLREEQTNMMSRKDRSCLNQMMDPVMRGPCVHHLTTI